MEGQAVNSQAALRVPGVVQGSGTPSLTPPPHQKRLEHRTPSAAPRILPTLTVRKSTQDENIPALPYVGPRVNGNRTGTWKTLPTESPLKHGQ